MRYKNKVFKEGSYIYKNTERRSASRAEFYMDIYYPVINSQSVYDIYKTEAPLMRTINISKTGILIESKIPLQIGDFINFTLKIKDKPSFWCLVVVKRIIVKESLYYLGCEFISLSMNEITIIDQYIKKF